MMVLWMKSREKRETEKARKDGGLSTLDTIRTILGNGTKEIKDTAPNMERGITENIRKKYLKGVGTIIGKLVFPQLMARNYIILKIMWKESDAKGEIIVIYDSIVEESENFKANAAHVGLAKEEE